jgi:hypothetical protein
VGEDESDRGDANRLIKIEPDSQVSGNDALNLDMGENELDPEDANRL